MARGDKPHQLISFGCHPLKIFLCQLTPQTVLDTTESAFVGTVREIR